VGWENTLRRELKPLGIEVAKTKSGRGHLRLLLPNGRSLFASATPSCPYALNHVRADVRRALREVPDRTKLQNLNSSIKLSPRGKAMKREELLSRTYLSSDDVKAAGGLIDGIIQRMTRGKIRDDDQKKKNIMFFSEMTGAHKQPVEIKPMIVNATNINFLFDTLKVSDSNEATGAKVRIIHDPRVMYAGRMVGGLRFSHAKLAPATYQAPPQATPAPQAPAAPPAPPSIYTNDLPARASTPPPTMPPAGTMKKDFDDDIPF
jgi:hypothetical protein